MPLLIRNSRLITATDDSVARHGAAAAVTVRSAVACLTALVTLAGCHKDSTGKDSTGPVPLNLTGNFSGPASGVSGGSAFSGTLTFTLAQSGTALTGTWNSPLGPAGSVSGTVNDTTVTFTLTQTTLCASSFGGTATVQNSGTRLSGFYAGSDCIAFVTATFVVDRL